MRGLIGLFSLTNRTPKWGWGMEEVSGEVLSQGWTHCLGRRRARAELVLTLSRPAQESLQEDKREGASALFRHCLGVYLHLPLAPHPSSFLSGRSCKEGTGPVGDRGGKENGQALQFWRGEGCWLFPVGRISPIQLQTEERRSCKWKNWGIGSVALWSGDFNSETTVTFVCK